MENSISIAENPEYILEEKISAQLNETVDNRCNEIKQEAADCNNFEQGEPGRFLDWKVRMIKKSLILIFARQVVSELSQQTDETDMDMQTLFDSNGKVEFSRLFGDDIDDESVVHGDSIEIKRDFNDFYLEKITPHGFNLARALSKANLLISAALEIGQYPEGVQNYGFNFENKSFLDKLAFYELFHSHITNEMKTDDVIADGVDAVCNVAANGVKSLCERDWKIATELKAVTDFIFKGYKAVRDDLSQEQGGGQIPDFDSRCMSIGYMNDLAKIFQYNWGDGDQLPYSDTSHIDDQVRLYILMMKTMEGFEDADLPDVVYERKGTDAVTDANAVIQQQRAQIDMQAAEIA